jgi:hypothetical protein
MGVAVFDMFRTYAVGAVPPGAPAPAPAPGAGGGNWQQQVCCIITILSILIIRDGPARPRLPGCSASSASVCCTVSSCTRGGWLWQAPAPHWQQQRPGSSSSSSQYSAPRGASAQPAACIELLDDDEDASAARPAPAVIELIDSGEI